MSKTVKQFIIKCSTCKKSKPLNNKTKTCDKCLENMKARRLKKIKNKIECSAIKENKLKCENKVSSKCGNIFCEKHIIEWKEYQETNGREVRRCNSRTQCNPNKPGIKAILPDGYTKKKCMYCLIKERKKEKLLRDKKKNINVKLQKESGLYVCTECPIDKKYEGKNMGLKKNGTFSHLCKHHFELQQKTENNRPKRIRIQEYREYENKPERKYKTYIKKARVRKINFNIDFETFKKMVMDDCYYCGLKRGKNLNGIDRLDSNKHYTPDNIVTSCKICNRNKNTLNKSTYILMCVHISHFNNILKIKLYPQIFNNYPSSNKYMNYKYSANDRNLRFDLSKEDFQKLLFGSCYICGSLKIYVNICMYIYLHIYIIIFYFSYHLILQHIHSLFE